MRCFFAGLWATALMFQLPALAQEIEVPLTRTTDDVQGISIEALSKTPSEPLTLPGVDTTGALFASVFYSWEVEGDELISILVLPDQDGERLYVDLNNDEDLTNDGGPRFFPASENEFAFYIKAEPDPEQVVGRLLYRVPPFFLGDPEHAADFREHYVDESGNLRPRLMMQPKLPADFTGQKGTFYFPERHSLSRGRVALDGDTLAIGLYDYSENGRFDDEEDLLYLDLNRDEKLGYWWTTEIFKLNDVIEVGDKRYKLSNVDPYGRSLRLARTKEAPTAYYLAELEAKREGVTGQLDPSFWALELESTEGEHLQLADLKGQHVLLNFWGEWCAPCIDEIPALVAIDEEMPSEQLQVIGMLLTEDQPAAEQVMREQGVQWPQVILTEELQERFKIQGYPTNLLVFPDGQTYLKVGQISEAFVRQHVK